MSHFDDEIAEDYKHEQQYFSSLSTLPSAKGDMIARYWKGWDDSDVVYVDRTTGLEVLRYDGGDPANTNPFYGATPDSEVFARKGLNIKETIAKSAQKVSDATIASRMRDLNCDCDYWD